MKKIVGFKTIIIISLFVTGVLLHLFKISDIPFGINVDEMGMGYDAYDLPSMKSITK